MRLDPRLLGQEAGHCWTVAIDPADFPDTDNESDPSRSSLILSENGVALGPQHTSHDLIRQLGLGRYSHWADTLYFSSSDNSDPSKNGRIYEIRRDSKLYFEQLAGISVATIAGWVTHIPGGLNGLRNRRVLEIGAGRSMGTAVAMATLGAEVLEVDRFCGDWQPDWHEFFLPALATLMERRGWSFDSNVINMLVAQKSFQCHNLHVEKRPIEELSDYSEFADFSFSHSTFEHVYSIGQAASSIATLSKSGSIGVHDVDFRDHKNFGSPLEFLLLDDQEYSRDEINDFYARGNRVRASAMQRAFEASGFHDVSFTPYEVAEASYLDGLLPRLREAEGSSFANATHDDLLPLGGTFVMYRSQKALW